MENSRGKLIVISGPSGAGKSTVIHKVMQTRRDVRFSVSATTRAPRAGEIDGKDYYFISREEFLNNIERNHFLEYAEYVGNMYGTPVEPINTALDNGLSVILDIEVQGAAQVKESMPEAVMLFLVPSDFSELEKRLRARNKDNEAKIIERLGAAKVEYAKAKLYDYIIVNDDADIAANELSAIITAEKCRVSNRFHHICIDEG